MSSPDNPQFNPSTPDNGTETSFPFAAHSVSAIEPPQAIPKAGENPVWNGWDVLLIAGLTLFALFITQLLIVLGATHFIYRHEAWLTVAQKPVLAILSELLTYVIIALFMFLLVEGKYRTSFGQAIRWSWPGIGGVSMIGIGVLMLGLDILGRFLPMPKSTPFDQFFATPTDAYLTAAFAVTLGPLMEELFFRGFLYPVIARRLGIIGGILLTALPFGLIHAFQYGYSWGAVLIIFLVGVVLTSVRAATKSVASSFLAHVGYNGTLMLLAAWQTDGFRHMEKAATALGSSLGTGY